MLAASAAAPVELPDARAEEFDVLITGSGFAGLTAASEATTRQLMEVLAHGNIEHAELSSRSAEQARLAHGGMQKVVKLVRGQLSNPKNAKKYNNNFNYLKENW